MLLLGLLGAVDEHADGVFSLGKAIVNVVALLVGLGAFVGALHILAHDQNLRV